LPPDDDPPEKLREKSRPLPLELLEMAEPPLLRGLKLRLELDSMLRPNPEPK
jgi:hypothetical protein